MGANGDVQDLTEVVPGLLQYRSADDGGWDHKALLRMHRLRLEESICHTTWLCWKKGQDAGEAQGIGKRAIAQAACCSARGMTPCRDGRDVR